MDPTRSQEPNHSQLTAEGNACDLHHTSTGQWSLTHNTESDAGLRDGNRQLDCLMSRGRGREEQRRESPMRVAL
jgi:hypothetical protein